MARCDVLYFLYNHSFTLPHAISMVNGEWIFGTVKLSTRSLTFELSFGSSFDGTELSSDHLCYISLVHASVVYLESRIFSKFWRLIDIESFAHWQARGLSITLWCHACHNAQFLGRELARCVSITKTVQNFAFIFNVWLRTMEGISGCIIL